MNYYDFILQGHEATLENAQDHARGQDWQSMDQTKQLIPYLQYKDTINGVDIWYQFGTDTFLFTDSQELNPS